MTAWLAESHAYALSRVWLFCNAVLRRCPEVNRHRRLSRQRGVIHCCYCTRNIQESDTSDSKTVKPIDSPNGLDSLTIKVN
jgi:hypothetical protein